MAVFDEKREGGMSADEVGKCIGGASRNTARRYLEYLTGGAGLLVVDIDYGNVGRPEKRFCKPTY